MTTFLLRGSLGEDGAYLRDKWNEGGIVSSLIRFLSFVDVLCKLFVECFRLYFRAYLSCNAFVDYSCCYCDIIIICLVLDKLYSCLRFSSSYFFIHVIYSIKFLRHFLCFSPFL